MKREQLWILAGTAAVLFLAAVVYLIRTRQVPDPAALPDRVDRGLARLETVQGRLTLSLNQVTLEQEMWLRLPDHLRAEIEEGPSPMKGSILVVNDQEAWMYIPELGTAMLASRVENMERDVGGSILLTLQDQVRRALDAATAIQVEGWETVAGRRALKVTLSVDPQATALGAGRITVWLDSQYFYPLALETDTSLTMRFHTVRFNEPLEDAYFQFVPPASVQVIRLR